MLRRIMAIALLAIGTQVSSQAQAYSVDVEFGGVLNRVTGELSGNPVEVGSHRVGVVTPTPDPPENQKAVPRAP
jgi:hypothetical protein